MAPKDDLPEKERFSVSRRDFLKTAGVSSLATAVTAAGVAEAGAQTTGAPVVGPGDVPVSLMVNGKRIDLKIEPRVTLLDALRNRADLTGNKRVCDRGSCGACTAIIDGEAVYSCTTLAVSCQGKTIETVESFDTGEHGVPHAFHQNDALMCGYCTPGFVTACKALLDKNPNPSVEEVKKGLEGNICRCGTYVGVMQAALAAAKAMKGA